MSKLLFKIFIKNYQNTSDPVVRNKYGNLASFFGIISNLFICILKLVVGFIFGLISLIGDGLNNLTDAGSSIVSLIGFKMASKPADKDHPFGHARIEYIAGFIVSMIIIFVGGQLILTSVQSIIENFSKEFVQMEDLEFYITIAILVIAILVKIYQGYFYYKVGNTISSLTLKATGCDSRNDVIATSVVLLGLVLSRIFSFYIDGYLGTLVGIFILISGFKLILETSNPLIGEKPSNEIIQAFCNKIKSYKGILGIHDLQIHSYGPNIYFATCHVEVDAYKNVLETHDLIDNIEKDIQRELNIITTLHMDPVVIDDPLTNQIKSEVENVLKTIPYIVNMHDFRIVKGPTHINIVFDVIVNQDSKLKVNEMMNEIHSKIVSLNSTYNPVITIDYDYTSYIE